MSNLTTRGAGGTRWIAEEHLNVAPELLGLPLARPVQRVLAMGLDLLLVALISSLANGLLLAALFVVAAEKMRRGRVGWVAGVAAGVLAVLGLLELTQDGLRQPRGTLGVEIDSTAQDVTAPAPPRPGRASSAPLAMASDTPEAATDHARIALLEAELARLRQERRPWRERLAGALDELGLGFGWALLYFSLLPVYGNGQTVGKRLLGLRVVELTGKPMTAMLGLKRYGGYAAGMATGGIGFAQVLWDSNRQAIQDKAAHTVVIDLRAPRNPDRTGITSPPPATT